MRTLLSDKPDLFMLPPTAPDLHADGDRLDVATDQAIVACGGNARDAVKALLIANEYLEAEMQELRSAVSNGYARGYRFGRFKTYTG